MGGVKKDVLEMVFWELIFIKGDLDKKYLVGSEFIRDWEGILRLEF